MKNILLSGCGCVMVLSSLFMQNVSAQSAAGENGQILVSSNKHFLQYSNGEPFFWLGDTGWFLFSKLTQEETKRYLEDREQKGFNVIQCMVVHSPSDVNVYGSPAFDKQKAPLVTPGTSLGVAGAYDYWDHIEWVIDEAARHGISIALVPAWGSMVKQGFFTVETAKRYAIFLAERFKSKSNIFWIIGGDMQGDVRNDIWQAFGSTIKRIDSIHLMTYHPYGRRQSSEWFHRDAWLDFNMVQSGHRDYAQDDSKKGYAQDNWRYIREDFEKLPTKPVLDGEPSYEQIPHGLHDTTQPYWQARDVRRYAYWAVLAGACGHTYGHNSIMQFYKSGDTAKSYGAKKVWNESLNDSGACEMQYLKKLILSRPYFDRVFDSTVIVGSAGVRYDFIPVAHGTDYLLAYTYTGRTFSLKMGIIHGKEVTAWWYDPRSGESTLIGLLPNTGTHRFHPPGKVSEGNDWVLVLDNVEKNFGKPGLAP
jgi:hypothetical protein